MVGLLVYMPSTNWSTTTLNSTNWSGTGINSTNYTGTSINATNWEEDDVSAGIILLQDGSSYLLLQNGTDTVGLQ